MIYVIGSLRNPAVPSVAWLLRDQGHEVFDDWYAAGPEADDAWKDYEEQRGRVYSEALNGAAARHVYEFDKRHLDAADAVVLILPAGRSGHLELGYALGQGKPGYILLERDADRWDVMYRFASEVLEDPEQLIKSLEWML